MINCIVVDDEPLARELIVSYVEQVPGLRCVGNYPNAIEAFGGLHEQHVDVIFIDIQMPGITGLSFIRSLRNHPRVIFTTAYTEYAVDAFEIDAVDYLVKPISFERFLKAIQKLDPEKTKIAGEPVKPDTNSIFLKVDRRLVKVDLKDIVHIDALGDYLKVHAVNQTFVTYMSVGSMEALLPVTGFIRIHRSTIVNKAFINFVEGNIVHVNNKELPIGATYRDKLFKSLNTSI